MGKLVVKYVSTYTKSTHKIDQQRTYLMMLLRCVSVFSSLYKGICCGYPFELHQLVDAIQMGIHNICLYKETDKKYTGCNLKTIESLACALIGVCDVIRSNTVLLKKSSDNTRFVSKCIIGKIWLVLHAGSVWLLLWNGKKIKLDSKDAKFLHEDIEDSGEC